MAIECGITSGVDASCADLRRVGGVNKRAFAYNVSGVTYTIDGNGYITAITFPTYEGLYEFESKKKSHSGGSDFVSGGTGANGFFSHSVILKLFATTPADDEVIEDLSVSSVGVILETNNREFVLYGKDNGLDLATAPENTGQEGASDVTATLTLNGEEQYRPKRILVGGSYEATLAYLEGLVI